MRVDINRLKGSIVASGLTQESLAKAIGIDNSTFSRKMKSDGVTFSVGQMHKMADVLSLHPDEARLIFFADDS